MVVQSGEPQPSWWANLPSDSRLAQGALNQSYSKFCCQHRWHWCTLKLGRTDFGFSFLIFTQSLLVLGPFQPKSSFSPLPSWGNMALSFSLKVAVSPFEQAHPLLLRLLSTFTQWPECPFKSGMLLGAEATGMPWERSLLPLGGRLLAGGDFLQHRQQARQASIKFTRWSPSARALTGKWHSKNIEPALRRVVSYLFIWLHWVSVWLVGYSSLTRNRTWAPCMETKSPSHWTTRGVPRVVSYFAMSLGSMPTCPPQGFLLRGVAWPHLLLPMGLPSPATLLRSQQ